MSSAGFVYTLMQIGERVEEAYQTGEVLLPASDLRLNHCRRARLGEDGETSLALRGFWFPPQFICMITVQLSSWSSPAESYFPLLWSISSWSSFCSLTKGAFIATWRCNHTTRPRAVAAHSAIIWQRVMFSHLTGKLVECLIAFLKTALLSSGNKWPSQALWGRRGNCSTRYKLISWSTRLKPTLAWPNKLQPPAGFLPPVRARQLQRFPCADLGVSALCFCASPHHLSTEVFAASPSSGSEQRAQSFQMQETRLGEGFALILLLACAGAAGVTLLCSRCPSLMHHRA